jgi:hypothetical protein
MCHSCVSSSPGCFVPGTVFLLSKRQREHIFWTAAFAAVTIPRPLTRLG